MESQKQWLNNGVNMTGTIKLYQNRQDQCGLKLEANYYRSELERKQILTHWKRKYNGQMNNFYIQVAPGVDLTKKHETT